jgi:hypothetical protein
MSRINGFPVNFTISERAKEKIAAIRAELEEKSPQLAGLLSISWGTYMLDAGGNFEGPVISFYDEQQSRGIAYATESVSGVELIYFITQQNYAKFEGKALDYDGRSDGFFVR